MSPDIIWISTRRLFLIIGGGFGVAAMLSKLFGTIRESIRGRSAEADLRDLSDAALDDIGLVRAGVTTLPLRAEPARGERAAIVRPSAANAPMSPALARAA